MQKLNFCSALDTGKLECGEVKGIPGVAVKCLDIRRNIGGVSALLGRN